MAERGRLVPRKQRLGQEEEIKRKGRTSVGRTSRSKRSSIKTIKARNYTIHSGKVRIEFWIDEKEVEEVLLKFTYF